MTTMTSDDDDRDPFYVVRIEGLLYPTKVPSSRLVNRDSRSGLCAASPRWASAPAREPSIENSRFGVWRACVVDEYIRGDIESALESHGTLATRWSVSYRETKSEARGNSRDSRVVCTSLLERNARIERAPFVRTQVGVLERSADSALWLDRALPLRGVRPSAHTFSKKHA